jgi:hypothetical protein
MATLIITTDNPKYNGVTFGVKFEEGRAALNEYSAPNRWNFTLEQLRLKFKTDLPGYTVEWIEDAATGESARTDKKK